MLEWVSKVDEVSFDHFKRTKLGGKFFFFLSWQFDFEQAETRVRRRPWFAQSAQIRFFFSFYFLFSILGRIRGNGRRSDWFSSELFQVLLNSGRKKRKALVILWA